MVGCSVRARLRLLLLRLIGALLRRVLATSTAPPRRILVIKPDHLGDVLLLTPALRWLRQHYPQATIVALIGPWSRAALAHNPDLDAVLSVPFPGFARDRPRGHMLQPYRQLLKLALLLRAGRFDAALIARDDHWWGALLAALAGIPRRVGYAVPEVAPLLTEALPHTYAEHVTRQALALVGQLSGTTVLPTPQAAPLTPPWSTTDHAWAARWLQQQGLAGTPLIALHPGAGGAAKLWPTQRWAAVADALAARGYALLLTGGPGEERLIAAIRQAMRQPARTLIGEATLGQLAALYRRCALVLGVDSGPLHLAVAAGAPTIALFGPGDHRRFGPWGAAERQRVVRSGLWCSPCGVLDHCPRGTTPSECLSRITVQQLLSIADELLAHVAEQPPRPSEADQPPPTEAACPPPPCLSHQN